MYAVADKYNIEAHQISSCSNFEIKNLFRLHFTGMMATQTFVLFLVVTQKE